ncbi:olfactory receptor 5V1-like [Pelodytes ibericus]
MDMRNHSAVTEFILLGFPDFPFVMMVLFGLFCMCYASTLLGNILIIITSAASARLRTPMYFFLGNLSFLEIFYISVTIPKMMSNYLRESVSISFKACVAQMFLFIGLGSVECTLLAVMAYDRYLAICKPLQYVTLMGMTSCLTLVCSSWVSGFLNSMIHTILILRLPFCGANQINQFFCDIPPLLKLACASTTNNELVLFVVGGVYGFGSFFLTFFSYVRIISTILKIKSTKGQRKAFSTCASHLIVVMLFYSTSFFSYLKPASQKFQEKEKLIPVIYAVITPTLNPIIYTLRNNDFKSALRKMCRMKLADGNRSASELK